LNNRNRGGRSGSVYTVNTVPWFRQSLLTSLGWGVESISREGGRKVKGMGKMGAQKGGGERNASERNEEGVGRERRRR
jgi:hypothetical protein